LIIISLGAAWFINNQNLQVVQPIQEPQVVTPVVAPVTTAPIKSDNQKLLESCLATAKADYQNEIKAHTVCESGVGCMVSYLVQPILDQKFKNDQDTCLKEYK
jgi:hypothetical protein